MVILYILFFSLFRKNIFTKKISLLHFGYLQIREIFLNIYFSNIYSHYYNSLIHARMVPTYINMDISFKSYSK